MTATPVSSRPATSPGVHREATIVRPLGPWWLAWLRLTRTRRWIGLAVPFLFFACTGPLTARYADELLSGVGTAGNITVQATAPTPADAMDDYTGNALQLGLLPVTLAVVLVLPLLAAIPALEPWMPSALTGAPTALLQGAGPGDYARAVLVAALASGAALLLAVRGVARREL